MSYDSTLAQIITKYPSGGLGTNNDIYKRKMDTKTNLHTCAHYKGKR